MCRNFLKLSDLKCQLLAPVPVTYWKAEGQADTPSPSSDPLRCRRRHVVENIGEQVLGCCRSECAPGTRAADIDGSSVTSVSNTEVDAVAASSSAAAASVRAVAASGRAVAPSGRAVALRSWACSSAICRWRPPSSPDESSPGATGAASSASRAGARTLRAVRRTFAGRAATPFLHFAFRMAENINHR